MDFNKKLKEQRQLKKITQKELGELLNVSDKTISSWETGRTYPDIVMIVKIADTFNLSLDDLLREDKKMIAKVSKDIKNKNKFKILFISVTVLLLLVIGFLFLGHRDVKSSNVKSIEIKKDEAVIEFYPSRFYQYSSYMIGGEAKAEELEVTITQNFNLFSKHQKEVIRIPLESFSSEIKKIKLTD